MSNNYFDRSNNSEIRDKQKLKIETTKAIIETMFELSHFLKR